MRVFLRPYLIRVVCLFVGLLYIAVSGYGQGRTVSSPNHIFPGQA